MIVKFISIIFRSITTMLLLILALFHQQALSQTNGKNDPLAETMVALQRDSGGWLKNVDYKIITTDRQRDSARHEAYRKDGGIDNGATTHEIRYLLQAYNLTRNPAYLSAADKGLEYLLKAQYNNGGWPQFYPDFTKYHSEITFNDDAMVNVLNLLQDLVEQKKYFEVADRSLLPKAMKAIEKAIDCIIKTQISVNGTLTAWCAQYDAKTLIPAKARSYELPSISGAESVSIVRFLMRIKNPSPEIKTSVQAAVKWFEKVKIAGYKTTRIRDANQPSGEDVVVVADPSSTIWARFYDLDTEQPYFCSRDGVKKKSLAEIDNERRIGYSWYVVAPQKLITVDYPLWLKSLNDSLHRLSSSAFLRDYGNLDNFYYRINKDKKATVAFLGGSITHTKGWREMVCKYLQDAYPQTAFNFVDVSVLSLGSLPHSFRLQNDLLGKEKVDLLFVESAVNDKLNETSQVTQARAVEGVIRQVLSANAATDIVLMAFADETKMTEYIEGKVPNEINIQDNIAKYYQLPFINLAEEVTRRIINGEFSWAKDFKGHHPAPFGHQLYFASIRNLLEKKIPQKLPSSIKQRKLLKPRDPLCYQQGKYMDIKQAVKTNGFIYDKSWKPSDTTKTREGFVDVPMLVSEKAGASFELNFTGSAVGIAIISGPDAGELRYNIDNGEEQQVDLYTKWSASLHLPWYILLGDGLSGEKHVLKVSISEDHNQRSIGNACRIKWFLVNG